MTERLPRIAIANIGGKHIGYECIANTFVEPEMLELFTPIIYGSVNDLKKSADAQQLHLKLNDVKSATDAKDNCINIIAKDDIANVLAERENYNALVLGHVSQEDITEIRNIFSGEEPAKPVIVRGVDGLSVMSMPEDATDEEKEQLALLLRNVIRRDLDCDNPRIAILSPEAEATVSKFMESSTAIFGPYTEQDLMDNWEYLHFDGILTNADKQCDDICKELYGNEYVSMIANLPVVITQPHSFNTLNAAVFAAIDIARNRHYYDLPLRNPLKKIYHERKEDGEKARFINNTKDK